jgi:hypothetical protein
MFCLSFFELAQLEHRGMKAEFRWLTLSKTRVASRGSRALRTAGSAIFDRVRIFLHLHGQTSHARCKQKRCWASSLAQQVSCSCREESCRYRNLSAMTQHQQRLVFTAIKATNAEPANTAAYRFTRASISKNEHVHILLRRAHLRSQHLLRNFLRCLMRAWPVVRFASNPHKREFCNQDRC